MTAEDLIKNNSLTDIEVTGNQTVVFSEIALTAVNMAREEVSPLPKSIGPKRDNRFDEAFEKASKEAMSKADSILRNKYPQFYGKEKD